MAPLGVDPAVLDGAGSALVLVGEGLGSVHNYSMAEAMSDVSGRSNPLPVPPSTRSVSAGSPPFAVGTGTGAPAGWGWVAPYIGMIWPNGDSAKLRAAAAAWISAGTNFEVSEILGAVGPMGTIGAQQMPEGPAIAAALTDANRSAAKGQRRSQRKRDLTGAIHRPTGPKSKTSGRVGPTGHTGPVLDLILPLECGGCGAPSTRWCEACGRELSVAADQPHVVSPRIDPEVPVFALGRYVGARRQAILAVKERGRGDLVAPLARALAVGVHRLLTWGIAETPLTIVPAPTRRSAARRRGGDPVARLARAAVAGHPEITVVPALRMKALARDSVGLGTAARERNVAGRVVLRGRRPGTEVMVVDDVVTTGATARESARTLEAAGVRVTAILAVAAA